MATDIQDSPETSAVTEEDLQDLHEDILDRNEEGVKEILKYFQSQDRAIHVLCSTEVLLEPAVHDHPLNRLALSSIHRAALSDSHGILSTLLTALPAGSINHSLNGCGYTPLHVAAAGGVLAAVNYLTSSGAQLNACDSSGNTPTHLAANSDILSLLCVRGASINSRNYCGCTPLHMAAQDGRVDCVEFLVGKNVDIITQDCSGKTALHTAQISGYQQITARILDRAPELADATDEQGNTPIHTWIWTWSAKHPDIASSALVLLLNSACDINIHNKDGDSALHMATYSGWLELVETMLDNGASVNKLNNLGRSPLYYAQSLEVCQLLIERGAKYDLKDYHGNTVLHLYCLNEGVSCEMINFIVENGVDVNAINLDQDCALHNVCSVGNINKLMLLLKLGAKSDVRNAKGQSIVHVALLQSQAEITLWLLRQNNLSVMIQDIEGNTLLHLAAQKGTEKVIQELVSRHIDINKTNRCGQTATSLAAHGHHLSVLAMMLRRGGAIDPQLGSQVLLDYVSDNVLDVTSLLLNQVDCNISRTKDGETALHLAMGLPQPDVARLLLQHGADITACDRHHRSPLHIACTRLAIMEVLISQLVVRENCNLLDTNGRTALHYGINDCTINTLHLFLRWGFNVSAHDNDAKTVTHVLLESTQPNVSDSVYDKLELLLQADTFLYDIGWAKLLHCGIMTKDPIIVKQLLDTSGDVDVTNESGLTALHYACTASSPETVSVLLKHGACVNKADSAGVTPLVCAVRTKSEALVRLLVTQGADLNIQENHEGKCALMIAMETKLNDICAELLIGSDIDLTLQDFDDWSLLHYASRYCNTEVVDAVLDFGVSVDTTSKHGSTALHLAALNDNVLVLKLLLSRGFNKDAKDLEGNTALHICSLHGSYEHVKTLLDWNAHLNLYNALGQSPVHLAAVSADPDVIQLLVANEADIDVIDRDGNTPLITSICCGNLEVATILVEQGANVFYDSGDSALHIALRKDKLNESFLKFLIRRHPSLMEIKNEDGFTAIDLIHKRTDVDDPETFAREIGLEM